MKIPLPVAKRRARIEIIPLIDIVFFLLATFVMVSMSMVKNQAISVNLPAASTAAPEKRDVYTAISVTSGGDIYFNKDKIRRDDLPKRLKALTKDGGEPRIFINGDENASFGNTVYVLDEARKLGIKKISIQTQGAPKEN